MSELEWAVFDLNGTLLDPAGLSAALPPPCDDEATGLALLDETVQQAMVDTLTGGYRPFGEYLRAAVQRRLALAGVEDSEAVGAALEAAGRMPAFPEVPEALALLRIGPAYTQLALKTERAAAQLRWLGAEPIARLDSASRSREQEEYLKSLGEAMAELL